MLHLSLVFCALLLGTASESALTPSQAVAVSGDVSGEWAGEVKTPVSYSPIPMYFKLQQKGSEVSGTAGPGASSQSPIKDVKRTGDRLQFSVTAEGKLTYTFDLVVKGDVLEGDARGKDDQSNTWDGKASMKRNADAKGW